MGTHTTSVAVVIHDIVVAMTTPVQKLVITMVVFKHMTINAILWIIFYAVCLVPLVNMIIL
jgi:hypothetical protein